LLAAREARDGPDTALAARHNLALTLSKDGQYVEAEEILRRLLPIERGEIGSSSPQALGCLRNLIEVLAAQGKGEEARELLGEGWVLVGEMEGNDPE
jgi:Tetratricopeptide repeat